MHERTRGFGVEFIRRIHLYDTACTQHSDAIGHLHGFRLVVSDKDAGQTHAVVQLAQPNSQASCAPWRPAHRMVRRAAAASARWPELGQAPRAAADLRKADLDGGQQDRRSPSVPAATAHATGFRPMADDAPEAVPLDQTPRCARRSYDGTARNVGIRTRPHAGGQAHPASIARRSRCRRHRRIPARRACAAAWSCPSPMGRARQ